MRSIYAEFCLKAKIIKRSNVLYYIFVAEFIFNFLLMTSKMYIVALWTWLRPKVPQLL